MAEITSELSPTAVGAISDEEVVATVLGGQVATFEIVMRRYNQRLFRVARSITGSDHDAEDVLQEAYTCAFEHLCQFAGRAKFSTWLTRITVHAALAKRKRQKRLALVDMQTLGNDPTQPRSKTPAPDHQASNRELGNVLRHAIDSLPADLRVVFMMRIVEGLDTHDAAACLGLSEANVKVRLHRARVLLRQRIDAEIGEEVRHLYEFGSHRCDRVVRLVLRRIT